MSHKLSGRNLISLLVIALLFILFSTIIYFGVNQIYKSEYQKNNLRIDAELNSANDVITVFFSNFKQDLFFLKNASSTKSFVKSKFNSIHSKNGVKNLFYTFAKHHSRYYQIRILDASGREVIRIDNNRDGSTEIIPQTKLQDKKRRYYFTDTMKLNKNQFYVSPIDLNIERGNIEVPYVPVVRIATPLFNFDNKKIGILIINMYFSRVLDLLPEGMFVQTQAGSQLSLNSDKSIAFKKSGYVFSKISDMLRLPNKEVIHYKTVKFFPGSSLIVGQFDSNYLLKNALQKLIFFAISVFAAFLILVLVIIYLNILGFRDLIGAQKAIIYSLASLADYRDPETGKHLERTRRYSTALANELRKNRKYKKIITDKFIQDLYDAAPLHDIGKVGIRDSILLKEGELTAEEFEQMKTHVLIGKKELQTIIDKFNLRESFLIMARNLCGYHHEKYNGAGYTLGLKRKQIPLEVKIFTLCDAYDAIRSKRSYKERCTHKEAVRRIKADSSKHFDPDIVNAFLKCQGKFLEISEMDD